MRKFKQYPLLEQVTITGIADRGKSVGRHDGQVVFVEGAVPGDVADIQVQSKKSGFYTGKAVKFHTLSPDRTEPFCQHFGVCGGCKWQYLDYDAQLRHKQNEVENALLRLGKVTVEEMLPIIGNPKRSHYRNKLEFTFSNRRWLTPEEMQSEEQFPDRRGMGFHLPGSFDKVLDLHECHLQPEPSEAIRKAIQSYSMAKGWSFYNVKDHSGFLRNLIVRVARTGETLVTVIFGAGEAADREELLNHLITTFCDTITSLNYVVNTKQNDTIYDLEVHTVKGNPYIIETLGDLKFRINPKSFFQTNTAQAEILYQTALDFAGLTGTENVYDLYTGLGSIACFIAKYCKHVTGIEEVAAAIEDAKENAILNKLDNTTFYAGDVKNLLNPEFVAKHGHPDVIITDPPRAGMHESVVNTLIALAPSRIVYVSCNPATQARDLALLKEHYTVTRSQAVDMFPQTQHIENVVLLTKI